LAELKSNAEWRQWGKDDPLWAVATQASKQKNGDSPWTDEEFYAFGASDWLDFVHHWRHYGLNNESCLEIGCGAGRITGQLATTFDRVYAIDVSEDMIRYARKHVDRRNVQFAVTDGIRSPQSDNSITAVFSTHVFQHLDSVEIGFQYLREVFRVLNASGAAMIHIPLYQFPNHGGRMAALFSAIWRLHRKIDDQRANMKRRAGSRMMRGTPYPMQTLYVFLAEVGFKNIEFRIFQTKSNGAFHSFVFVEK
jgi:ubiquinone/menaquinone biosynthesis C-methylase UbiE